jgi:hypothetical protein
MARDDVRETKIEHGAAPAPDSVDPTAGRGWAGAVPNLPARTVVAVFGRGADLEPAYGALRAEGIGENEISIVRPSEDAAPPVGAGETKAEAGATTGAAAGAVIGGLAGLAALAIPGIGPLLVAGPIAAVLAGAVTGGALGGLVGSFAGLGIPTEDAERFEAAVRSGGTFMAVRTGGGDEADRVRRILEERGAEEISSYNPTL